jgi:hypothetical protein
MDPQQRRQKTLEALTAQIETSRALTSLARTVCEGRIPIKHADGAFWLN